MATIAIGDVHGNLPALDDLLRTLEGRPRSSEGVDWSRRVAHRTAAAVRPSATAVHRAPHLLRQTAAPF